MAIEYTHALIKPKCRQLNYACSNQPNVILCTHVDVREIVSSTDSLNTIRDTLANQQTDTDHAPKHYVQRDMMMTWAIPSQTLCYYFPNTQYTNDNDNHNTRNGDREKKEKKKPRQACILSHTQTHRHTYTTWTLLAHSSIHIIRLYWTCMCSTCPVRAWFHNLDL